jgi:hypothetical protein
MKPIKDENFSVSIDYAAFNKALNRTMADILSGRITPAEARRINAEQNRTLKAVEQVLKYGQTAKRVRRRGGA